jgi:NAD(P)-dependent dehydrogenase (short-subunit alcohol dehydrogenase family)
MTSLAGKTAVVTGASRGIGLATAASLHGAGANVVLTSRHAAEAEQAASGLGSRALGLGAHAADGAAAADVLDACLARFGSIDVLVNNAGTNPAAGDIVAQEYTRFVKTFDVNVWAPILWSSLAYERFMKENGGVIINVASLGAFVVTHGIGVYNASKAALLALTRQLAVELAPAVRVNAVAPGVVRTRLAEGLWRDHEDSVVQRTPAGRIGEPDDVARAITFLASDEADWITGASLVVDGGQLIDPGS